MRRLVQLHDRYTIATWLRRDVAMNIFSLCDLDTDEWARTKWLALLEDGEVRSLLLIYSTGDEPFVLLHGPSAEARALIDMAKAILPRRFHLSVAMPFDGTLEVADAELKVHADYIRMKPGAQTARKHGRQELVSLTLDDTSRVRRLLFESRAYPDAWFNAQTLRSGLYRGWIENEELLGIIGVQAASAEYRVAAIGNLAVHPAARGKGIGRILVETVADELKERGWESAFNVVPSNTEALALYAKTGCQTVSAIKEFEVVLAWHPDSS